MKLSPIRKKSTLQLAMIHGRFYCLWQKRLFAPWTRSPRFAEVLQADLGQPNIAGTITVDAEPNALGAPWRLQGPGGLDFIGSGDRAQIVSITGEYTLTWLDVDRWTLPQVVSESQTMVQDGAITFSGTYSDGPFGLHDVGSHRRKGDGRANSQRDCGCH